MLGIVYAIPIVVALVLFLVLGLLRNRRQRAELDLRTLFEPASNFIGRDINYVLTKAGPSTYFGGMDHGREVAQWEAGRLVAEVWFQSGVCTEVEVRERKK
jgi:hypothetical protein